MANQSIKAAFERLWQHTVLAINKATVKVDTTLSQEGKAADAKAVGEALAGKQPIGNYIKTINGNAPDENGDIVVEISSGEMEQIQSDWNVSNRADLAYIKNKPFYEDANGWATLRPCTELRPFVLNTSFNVFVYEGQALFNGFTVGDTYRITWDGISYECVAQDANALIPGAIACGNCAPFGYIGNNEPFIVIYTVASNGNWETFCSLTDTSAGGLHSVGIEKVGNEVHKLDSKFLHAPDWNVWDKRQAGYIDNKPFGTIPSGTIVIEETTVVVGENHLGVVYGEPNIGPYNYIVEFDGVNYPITCKVTEYAGIVEYWLIYESNGETVFGLGKNFQGASEILVVSSAIPGKHTFKVTLAEDVVEKIESKYLPDNIGDSSLPEVTTADAGKFLRVTDEGVWAAVAMIDVSEVGL